MIVHIVKLAVLHCGTAEIESMGFTSALNFLHTCQSCHIGVLINAYRVYHEQPSAVFLLKLGSELHTEYGRMDRSSGIPSYVLKKQIIDFKCPGRHRITAAASSHESICI